MSAERLYIQEGRGPTEQYVRHDIYEAAIAEAVERAAAIAEQAAAKFWNHPDGPARIANAVRNGDQP